MIKALFCLLSDDEDDLQEDLSSLTEKANIDSLRLSKFLQRAAQVGGQTISNSFPILHKNETTTYGSVGVLNKKTPHSNFEGVIIAPLVELI